VRPDPDHAEQLALGAPHRPGKHGHFDDNGDPGVPIFRPEQMETNNVYTTGAWTTPGTYFVTCSVHITMTVEVVVTDCCCT